MSSELPDPWGAALSEKGVHSYQDLADAIGTSKSTAHRLVTGGQTSVTTVQAVADKFFAGDMQSVYRLRGSRLRGYGPWTPPAEVLLLTPKQREALNAVIAAMIPDEMSGQVEGGVASPSPPTPIRPPAKPKTPHDRAIEAGASVQRRAARKRTTPRPSAPPAEADEA